MVISGKLYAGPEIDVWSYGVVLYALLFGCLPFDEDNRERLRDKIKGGQYTVPKHVTPDAGDLLKRLLCVDPLSRITIPQLRDHPWFQVRLPRHLFWRPGRLTEQSRVVDRQVLALAAHFAKVLPNEITRHLFSNTNRAPYASCHPHAVTYNILADKKRKADIAELESMDGVSSEASNPGQKQFGVQELNLGLVLTASPGICMLLDNANAKKYKHHYNGSNFLPASFVAEAGKAATQGGFGGGQSIGRSIGGVGGSSLSTGFSFVQSATGMNEKANILARSVNDRVSNSMPKIGTGFGLGLGVGVTTPVCESSSGMQIGGSSVSRSSVPLMGSVAKPGDIYDTTEEAVAVQSLAGWRIGVMTDETSEDAMRRLFSVLKSFELEWCQVQPFVVAVRCPPEQQPVRGKFVIQINLMRIKENPSEGYVFDFEIVQGHSLPAMEMSLAILTMLCPASPMAETSAVNRTEQTNTETTSYSVDT